MSDLLRFDLSKNSIGRPIVFGRVGDGASFSRNVQIFKGGVPFDLTGWKTTFEGVTHEGKTKVFDSDGIKVTNEKRGEFTYTFPNMAFAVAGSYEVAYFSFMKDGRRESTDNFEIIVYGNADIDAEEAETIVTEYNKLVNALNKAYQAALNKMNVDYNEVVKRIETIKTQMNQLQATIDKTVSNAEERISTVEKTVTDALNKALKELQAADFYTQSEANDRFITKTSANGLFAKKDDVIHLDTNFKQLTNNVSQVTQSVDSLGIWSKQISRTQEFGYGLVGQITRVGNLVIATCNANQKNGQADGAKNLTERIPVGFRPAYRLAFKSAVYVGTAYQDTRHHKIGIKTDGAMDVTSKNMDVAPLEISFSVVWVTNDPMPSDV